MSDQTKNLNPTRERVFQAIQDSWSAETSGSAEWSPRNPSWQQCDVSAFVAWEYLGVDLVLGKVSLDGVDRGFHYWNRIDGHDVDLTKAQFTQGETIDEAEVLAISFIIENARAMRPEVADRIAIMRGKVRLALTEASA